MIRKYRVTYAVLLAVFILPLYSALAKDDLNLDLDTLQKITTNLKKELNELPTPKSRSLEQVDSLLVSITETLSFALMSLRNGNKPLAIDSLSVAKGTLSIAYSKLPDSPSDTRTNADKSLLEGKGLSPEDISNVREMLSGMSEAERLSIPNLEGIVDRLAMGQFDLAELEDTLSGAESSLDQALQSVTIDISSFEALVSSLNNAFSAVNSGTASISDVSRSVGEAMAQMGASLDQVASAVAESIAAGVDVDLEAAAQGLGFDSFSSAVDAYNAQHGTSYTVDSAKEALGK